jgi:hypothetical protein
MKYTEVLVSKSTVVLTIWALALTEEPKILATVNPMITVVVLAGTV